MSTKHSVFDVAFKTIDDNEPVGRFEALVSVFGNVDVQGDRVVPGAFQKSIEEWRAKGAMIPVIWSHDWGNPNAHIGYADPNDVEEVETGLKVAGNVDLDNPFAAQVYRLMKRKQLGEFSFAYEIRDEKRAKDGANDLRELGIIEVGPTLKGANPATELLSIKSDLEAAAAKAGRRISRATESELRLRITALRAEIDAIEGLLPTEDSETEKTDAASQPEGPDTGDDLRIRLALEAAR